MTNGMEKQVFDALNKAKQILICLPQNPNGDCLGAGLALFKFLKKLDKTPEIVCAAADLAVFKFLPASEAIKKTLAVAQSFVISVNTAAAKLDELSYNVGQDRLDIYLKPKQGKFVKEDVTFRDARFPYELIVTLDTPSLEHLGEIYDKNTDLFFETPIVNIDHHPNNEHYGQINLVDLVATSSAEILARLLENFEEGLLDQTIATLLLAGIIVETNSFQHVKTTPQAFLRASKLIALGGDHQAIIRELYKTKQISLLKLWGRALARLREVKELGLAYTLLSYTDFARAESREEEVAGVMKELVANLAGRKIILLLAEIAPREIAGYFHLHPNLKFQVVASSLGAQMLNGSSGTFRLAGTALLDAEKLILEKLEKIKDQIAA